MKFVEPKQESAITKRESGQRDLTRWVNVSSLVRVSKFELVSPRKRGVHRKYVSADKLWLSKKCKPTITTRKYPTESQFKMPSSKTTE